MKFLTLFSFVVCCLCFGFLAKAQSAKAEYQQRYAENIQKEYLHDVYIPVDIHEAIEDLVDLSPVEDLKRFQSLPEEECASKLRFGLGRWIEVNWNLIEGSRYSHYLRTMGISYPDDMIDFTLVSLHRYLNDKDLEVKERAAEYFEKRKTSYFEKDQG